VWEPRTPLFCLPRGKGPRRKEGDMATTAELLASVETAIQYQLGKIAEGSYLETSFGGVRLKDYDLESLYRLRKHLKAEMATNSGSSGFSLRRIKSGGMT
jgi:hypothetical protein